jgi:hypothetical protein
MNAQLSVILPALLGAAASLIAVSAALIAVLPAVIRIAQAGSSDVFSLDEARQKIAALLKVLITSVVLLSLSMILSVCGLVFDEIALLWIIVASFFFGVLFLIVLSVQLATLSAINSRRVMSADS